MKYYDKIYFATNSSSFPWTDYNTTDFFMEFYAPDQVGKVHVSMHHFFSDRFVCLQMQK